MAGKVHGKITACSEAGDLLTDITAAQLVDAPRDERVSVSAGGHQTIGIHGPDHSEPEMTFLALLSPDDGLRLTIVGDSARIMLGLRAGEEVVVEWQ
ncbi:MAG: hypothetical protein KDA41_01840 [Planctomycetales bacterium]|nr:hypothetical protein [Planctomycetales bacterium]